MHRFTTPLIALVALAVPPRPLAAQHEHGGSSPEKLGRVVFPTSCAAASQPRFERAVALLHSFWYEEATRAFSNVIASDSMCAMAWWGRAMSNLHPLWTPPSRAEYETGLTAAERAVFLARQGSREHGYAEAIAAFYRGFDRADFPARLLAYERAMSGVVERNPGDKEARIFFALALIANGMLDTPDTSLTRQRRAGEILQPLFDKDPQHPGLAHYLIHAYDYPAFATRAVAAAGQYAGIAPSVPHAHHMPSHIYTRIGQWDKSIASNLRSADAARQFEVSQKLTALWDQHGHALDYLVYAYLQQGKDAKAKAIVEQASRATASFPPNSLINHYALAAIPARYALERGAWAEAASLPVQPAPSWRGTEGITHFARALGAARSGDSVGARAAADTLQQLETALAQAQGPQVFWATQVKIQRLGASAWAARAAGDSAQALRLAREAADLEDVTEKHPVTPGSVLPARELLGDMLVELGRPDEALTAYGASISRQPNRARTLLGAARAAAATGNAAAAREWYSRLLSLTKDGNGTRPELAEARRAVGKT